MIRNILPAIALATVLALTLMTGTAAAERWGTFKRDRCVAVDKRQYSARLWDIRGDWARACRSTGANIHGQKFAQPARCKNLGSQGMWGEFDVNDKSCKARWGQLKRDACVAVGKRQYSARLWDIPGTDWAHACRSSSTTIGGVSLLPARCKNLGAAGMWGEFEVADASCPFWGNETGKAGVVRGACVAVNHRKYHARLWDIPAGGDWLPACRNEPQVVAGQATARPTACIWKGPLGMWGEWLVKDTTCTVESLPKDERRRAIANAKLTELGHLIASKMGFVHQVHTNPKVKASLAAGDEQKVAASVNVSAAAKSDGYLLRTMTIGATVSTKFLVVGGQAEAGAAIDLKGTRPIYAYGSAGYDWGPGLAAGGGINVGFWVCQNNKIGGDVWGVQFGVDDLIKLAAKKPSLGKGVNFTIGLWFDYANVFQGFTLTPGLGVGANYGGLVYATTAVDGDDTLQCDGRAKEAG
jgi:hypothetical protein